MKLTYSFIFLACLNIYACRAINAQLLDAAFKGDLSIVQGIVEQGTTAKDVAYAFQMSAKQGHLSIVRYLVERVDEFTKNLALSEAAEHDHWDIVEYLSQHGVDQNRLTMARTTRLLRAADSGNIAEVQRAIMVLGADRSAYNKALKRALKNNNQHIADYLMQRGADRTAAIALLEQEHREEQRWERRVQVSEAIVEGDIARIQELFQEQHEVDDYNAEVPIESEPEQQWRRAVEEGDLTKIQELFQDQPEVQACVDDILFSAAMLGHASIVTYVLDTLPQEQRANIQIINRESLLEYILLEACQVESSGSESMTGYRDVVKILIQHGAITSYLSPAGQSLLLHFTQE